jgi:hypothetical protein
MHFDFLAPLSRKKDQRFPFKLPKSSAKSGDNTSNKFYM